MKTWLITDLSVLVGVIAITGIIIPQILLIAFRKKLFDEIDARKIHKGTVPRLGGIAFFPAIFFAMLMVFGISTLNPELSMINEEAFNLRSFSFLTCSIIILYLVGMADDLVGLKYKAKFVAQIISAVIVVAGGIVLSNLHGFLWIHEMPYVVAVLLTILLTVFITNAINLIDGIDGLASGLSGIACAFYGFVFYSEGLHFYAMLSFATLGALVQFFYYNVFGNAVKHKKIFMGDTGALTIGLILSILSIRVCMIERVEGGFNPAVVAIAPLLIPCLDVVRVYLQRIRHHHNPFLPDKNHIHHKLLALGISQRVAMPTIVGASIVLTVVNYWLSGFVNITLLFVIDIVVWTVANLLLSAAIRRRH